MRGVHGDEILLALLVVSCFLSGAFSQGNVTLELLTIFRTHEWLGKKPSLYFRCKDENRIELPDVKVKDHVYKFLGHESWQPLTSFEGVKCKRCGLYEKNEVLKDGVFDEWEFCPDAFDKSGHCVHFKEGEFNATFSLLVPQQSDTTPGPNNQVVVESPHRGGALAAVIVLFVVLIIGGTGMVAYAKWQQRKREEQQARFMKLFEEDDDLEAELGLEAAV